MVRSFGRRCGGPGEGGSSNSLTVTEVAEVLRQAGEPVLSDPAYVGSSYEGDTDLKNNISGQVEGLGSVISTVDVSAHVTGGDGQGVAVDPADGTFWLTDALDDLIHHVALSGTQLDSFAVTDPTAIAVDPSDGTLWVGDDYVGKVTHYDRSGNSLSRWDADNFLPNAISIDPVDGTVWYADNGSDTVFHVNRDGSSIASWPAIDPGSNDSPTPTGLAIDPFDGTLWATFQDNFDNVQVLYNLKRDGTIIDQTELSDGRRGLSVDPADGAVWTYNSGSLEKRSTRESVFTVDLGAGTYALPRTDQEKKRQHTEVTEETGTFSAGATTEGEQTVTFSETYDVGVGEAAFDAALSPVNDAAAYVRSYTTDSFGNLDGMVVRFHNTTGNSETIRWMFIGKEDRPGR